MTLYNATEYMGNNSYEIFIKVEISTPLWNKAGIPQGKSLWLAFNLSCLINTQIPYIAEY